VGVATVGLQLYQWKTQGPGKILQSIIKVFKPQASEQNLAEMEVTQTSLEAEEITGLTTIDILSGVLAIIGVLLLVVGTILELIQLVDQLHKIEDSKNSFNDNYNEITGKLEQIIDASEKFRRHGKAA
jgi:hypothetical protein